MKRDLHVYEKRPTYILNETLCVEKTYKYEKRTTYIYQETKKMYMETCINMKRDLYVCKDIYTYEKRSI